MPTSSLDSHLRNLANMIKDIKIAMLTTANSKGVLHSRPMATQQIIPSEFDGRLWFFTKQESLKVNDIVSDKHVNITYSDHDKNHYVSVSGKAKISYDKNIIKELWIDALNTWFEGPEDPELALICVEVQDAHSWDGPQSKVTQLIEMAQAFWTGKAIDRKGSDQEVHLHKLH